MDNNETIFQKLTKAIVDRVVGSMSSRLKSLGQRINGSGSTPSPRSSLMDRMTDLWRQRTPANSQNQQPNPSNSPSASPARASLLDKVLGTLDKATAHAKSILDGAISKAERWITSTPQRLKAGLRSLGNASGGGMQPKGPLSTPGARRRRTRRIRMVAWGRAKQAWQQIKATWAARRSIARQQRSGAIPYDPGQLERTSVRGIVLGEQFRQTRAKLGASVGRLMKRTGLDYFGLRSRQTLAARLVKKNRIRLNRIKRKIFRAGGVATPAMAAERAVAEKRLASSQLLLSRSTTAASVALGTLTKTAAGTAVAVASFPFVMKAMGDSQVERNRSSTQFSLTMTDAMGRYDIQTQHLNMLKAQQTAQTGKELVDSQIKLREAMIKLEIPLANLVNMLMTRGVNAATKLLEGAQQTGENLVNGNFSPMDLLQWHPIVQLAKLDLEMLGFKFGDANPAPKARPPVPKQNPDLPDPIGDMRKLMDARRRDGAVRPIKPLR